MTRIDDIHESEIRKVFAAAKPGSIDLSIGIPDFPVPEEVSRDMKKAIDDGMTRYTQSAGLPKLKDEIMKNYGDFACADKIIITSGVGGGIFLSLSALIEDGDEVIIFSPYFVMYPEITRFLGGIPVKVPSKRDFSVDIERLEKAITKKTKAFILNSPNNPTGYVIPQDEMDMLVEIAKEHDLWIVSDEVYSRFDYDGRFCSPGKIHEKTILLDGFSKSHAMTGLRVGYAIAPKRIIDDMEKLQQFTFVCAPSIAQHGLLGNTDYIPDLRSFKRKRELVSSMLAIPPPQGSFYAYLPLEGISGKEFSRKCADAGVLVVPGSAFEEKDDHIRISYSVPYKDLEKGLEIITDLLSAL